ncbi:hypothetical protein ACJIZ3_002726 [Penstemon smallii]|uniref:Uncharacterized protein n=1 Tax=Penstemon smallii TaxID=265156 RepID=A0ABD3UA09_9LAMI
MKLSIIGSSNYCSSKNNTLFDSATDDELFVAQILLDLKDTWAPFKWGCTRKRSALLDEGAPSSSRAPSPLSVSVQDEIQEKMNQVIVKEDRKDGSAAVAGLASASATTASPDTPLSFVPSESDEFYRRSSKKRSREYYVDMIEKLTKRRDCLRGEIENVKKYHNKLKVYNSELKAVKQEVLKSFPRKEETQKETNRVMNHEMELAQHYGIKMVQHHQPSISDQTVQNFQYSFSPITAQLYPPNNGFGSVNHVGPIGIPDLNLSLEENFGGDQSQPLDTQRAIAERQARCAEARRMRRGIIKIKSMRSACGIKLPKHS